MASTKKELEAAEAAVRQARGEARKIDPRAIEQSLAKADAEYRTAVNKSQLHSYTSMVTGKAVAKVTEADVKSLEKFLIIIPAIAARFASTLIAITAVRRIKPGHRRARCSLGLHRFPVGIERAGHLPSPIRLISLRRFFPASTL
jgi:hypothetical protein